MITMKHKNNNRLVIAILIVSSIAVVWMAVNTAVLVNLYHTQYASDVNDMLMFGRINNLIECAHGSKNVCNAITKLELPVKNDGLLKQD